MTLLSDFVSQVVSDEKINGLILVTQVKRHTYKVNLVCVAPGRPEFNRRLLDFDITFHVADTLSVPLSSSKLTLVYSGDVLQLTNEIRRQGLKNVDVSFQIIG